MLSSYQMFTKERLMEGADRIDSNESLSNESLSNDFPEHWNSTGDNKKVEFDLSIIAPFMAAIEMIHTYSLIHDDLPAMDNDDLRRGKPTCHIKFNEANAILAGDALLNYAFELTIEHTLKVMEKDPIIGHRCLKAMKILSAASGIYGMIGGQGADMLFESAQIKTSEDLDYIHRNKTGSLITASLTMGGILGGCSEEQLDVLTRVGNNIGLAFQIQDDILDLTSSEEILGKPIGSDVKNNKKTYISLVGLEQSKKDVAQLLLTSIELIKLQDNNSLLLEVIEFLDNREY
jgi:geranylgeranyl diphosphate synthase type II